ncbi:MAG: TonB-dependent receptor [Bacteroidales bacterium]|jgi:TonB-linked SusC/RagA family outer membrane protein|nr:TonB-dependent receptor [Bacteroidales bacterium]
MKQKKRKSAAYGCRRLCFVLSLWGAGIFSLFAQQQGIRITGTVSDERGDPLPGVTVLVRGSTIGTSSNMNGEFILTVPSDTSVLQFTFMGYRKQETMVGQRRIIAVSMAEEAAALDEVTIVAFGTQKKSSVIASITTVKPSDLKVPSSNLTTAFAGRMAGVISYQRSGEPGADNADFFIRGVTTFGYSKDPLILIDGIESSKDDLSRVQTDDLESFSIMKDATATAMYGSRAANGVILIKTKEGREGPANISFRFENSMSMPTSNVELADPITYMKLHNEAVMTREPLGRLPYSLEKIDNTIAGTDPYMYPVTDWRKEVLKDYAMNQRFNLSVGGGGKVANYYMTGAFNRSNGLLKVDKRNNFNSNIDLKTYSLRLNVNVHLTKTTLVSARINGTFDDYTGPRQSGTQVYRDVMRSNPVLFPPYFPPDEEHQWVKHIMFGNYADQDGSTLWYMNPYAEMVSGYRNYSRSVMNAQFEVKQDLSPLIKGLNLRTMLNTTRNAYFEVSRRYVPFWYQATSYNTATGDYKIICLNEEGTGKGEEYLSYDPGSRTISSSFYSESSLDYRSTFADKHDVGAAVVFMLQTKLSGQYTDLQQSLPYRNVGLAGRATYAYDERYFTELSFGYNASERFHESNRWGFFPSVGAAWTVSNEAFWESLKKTVNALKLKFTFGLSGNDALGDANTRFLYLSRVDMESSARAATFGRNVGTTSGGYSRNGVAISQYSDENIRWEIAQKTNIGLELGLYEKLMLQVDVYQDKRSNILQTRTSTPAEMGLSAQPRANIGKAEGKGIDLSLDYSQNFNSYCWIQGRANFTYAASKFVIYEEYDYEDAWWKSHRGYSVMQEWGYLAERLFVDDAEAARSPRQTFSEYGGGDIKYYDMNKDGQITTLDQAPIGYPTVPEIVYGFGFSAGYKQFDCSVFFQGLARESFWINRQGTAPFVSYTYSGESFTGIPQNQLLKAYADSHWSEDNQDLNAIWPRLSTSNIGNGNNFVQNTWFMRDGAFLRLKQVEIGYSLPEKLAEKLYMKTFRIYLNATNPFLWSNFDLWDVEMGGNGLGYPIQKVFNAGLFLTF